MLKAGILEIGDVFVVNKADMDGADRTVSELEEMIHMQRDPTAKLNTGHHAEPAVADSAGGDGHDGSAGDGHGSDGDATDGHGGDGADDAASWTPEVVETVATSGEGVDDLVETLSAHREYLEDSGALAEKARTRYAEEIRTLVRNDSAVLLERELERRGGVEALAEAVAARETDPYTVADEVVGPLADCLEERE
jgi:LAO/AO transport system kinase